ncbi:SLBB domain-containing protein, partial [Vibrio sp.]|uniref:SLBB domain-containing protein n=1 Tax=Vibrio sp. TaxID=678 RepID=UPI003D0F4B23
MFDRRFTFFSSLLLSLCAFSAYAQSPTPEQLRMFQNLPADQQAALAQQYGISLPKTGSNASQPLPMAEINTPRPEHTEDKAQPTSNQDQTNEDTTELTRFGLELFASSPSTFAPVSDVPIPADYRVGPGDELVIQLFGKENTTHRLRVNREGVINFPALGPISVAGLSFSEVRASLSQRVQEQMIGVRSDITLGELRTMQIFVMGEAYKPGAYTVSALTTISQAIYYSGGFSKSGALRNIQLKRHGQVVQTLDMYDLLLKGDTSADVRLMPGDVVWIAPVQQTITVKGEVQRPAIYEIKPGETYQDILTMVGGLTANALPEQVQIKRLADHGLRNVLTLNLTKQPDLAKTAHKGDELTVSKRSNLLQQYIQLQGDITQPGFVEWRQGIRISDLFHSPDSAFNPTADMQYALVVREINQQRDIRVLQFSLADALLNPDGEHNLALHNRDQVIVFNRDGGELDEGAKSDVVKSFEEAKQQAQQEEASEKQQLSESKSASSHARRTLLAPILLQLRQQATYDQPAPIAELIGEVKYPGRYPISQQGTLQDLLVAAGGLSANAYANNAELTRGATQENPNLTVERINLHEVVTGQRDVHVYPRDRLNVFEQPGVNHEHTVVLKGEVKFPGIYTIRRGETLAQLLQRAGGLTEFAHPQGAIFTREALRQQEQKLLSQYAADMRREVAKKTFNADSRVSNVINDPDKTLAFIEEATKQRALGRMVVQLDQIIDGYAGANFMLEDGDFLFVPTYRNTVSIMGEVQVGITYLLDPSLTVDDYINRAGGMKKQADDDRIFVVRADGSVFKPNTGFWFGHRNEALKPGDTIVVPVDTDYRDALNVWTAATQILYQTGVAVNALK